jgi:hypothetical protein
MRKGTREPFSLRWLLVYLIAEYARHNGHADLLRERLDGATGHRHSEAQAAGHGLSARGRAVGARSRSAGTSVAKIRAAVRAKPAA